MNNLVTLSIISLACMVTMATAFFGPTGGYGGYTPMYYGGGGGSGAMGGGFFSSKLH